MGFTNLMLTTAGKAIYAKAELGKPINIARIAVGDGVLTGSATSRTALVRERMSLPIDGMRLVSGGTETAITTTMDNRDLTEGFPYREIGIFIVDPDTSAQVLCLYDNAGTDAEEIPPGNIRQVYERLVFILRLDSTKDISFVWSGNPLYPTLDEFEGEVKTLRQDISPTEEKATPVDTDSLVLADSAAEGKKRRLTWGNLVAAMKSGLGKIFAELDPGTGKVKAEQMPELDFDPAGSAEGVRTELAAHVGSRDNPHGTTAAQVGADPAGSAAAAETRAKAASRPVGWVPGWGEVTGKPGAFPPSGHGHGVAEVSGLQGVLDGKATAGHGHTAAQVGAVPLSGGAMTGALTVVSGTATGTGSKSVRNIYLLVATEPPASMGADGDLCIVVPAT